MHMPSWTIAGLLAATLAAAPLPQTQGPSHLEQAQKLLQQAQGMEPQTQREDGRKAIRDALGLLDRIAGANADVDVMSVRWRLAMEAYRFAAIVAERETWRAVCAYYEQLPQRSPEQATYHRAARQNLARALGRTGFEKEAYRLMHDLLRECTETFGPEHEQTRNARWDLGTALMGTGPLSEARDIWQGFLDRMQDVPDHDATKLQVLDHLQQTLWGLGEYAASLALRQRRVRALEAAKAPVNKYYLQARVNVAAATRELRGPEASLPMIEEILHLCAEHLDPGDEAILRWHANQLVYDLRLLGDTDQAIERLRAAMRQFEQHHPDFESRGTYQQACRQLGNTYGEAGDFASALAWHEKELQLRRQFLPPEDTAVLEAMKALAGEKMSCGDYEGARPLYEEVLRTRIELLSSQAPAVQLARISLANCLEGLGEPGPSLRLLEDAIAALEAAHVAPAQASLLLARNIMAWVLTKQGESARAVEILRDVIAKTREARPHSQNLYYYLDSLALAEWQTGALDDAVATYREAMAGLMSLADSGLLECQRNFALVLAAAGSDDLADLLKRITNLAQSRLSNLLPLSSREITTSGEQIRHVLDVSLSLARPDMVSDARLFELFESLRAASIPIGNVEDLRGSGDFAALQRQLRAARQQLNDLSTAAQQDEAAPDLQRKIEAAAARRDTAEKNLRAAWSRAGFDPRRIPASDVAARLRRGEAAVGYHRYRHWTLAAAPPHLPRATDHLMAFVVMDDGTVARCDLGPAAAVEQLIQDWRAAVGKPLPRGRAVDDGGKPDLLAIGTRLRELVVDPVLAKASKPAKAGKAKLYVCLDDVLHLVPLDALPLSATEVIGDRHELMLLSSFAQLVAPRKRALVGGALVAFGGIDFAAELPATAAAGTAPTPPIQGPMRAEFYPLRHTRLEVEDLEEMFKKFARGRMQTEVRTEAAASKQALRELAPQARYLHLATHGYFAPESVRSLLDATSGPGSTSLSEIVKGLAPLTLCGLAFAGAQHGRDASGGVPGILTAEELSGLDLHRCQLAVLSACETNVGIRRAGQGIRSLQAALLAAGAQQAVTSLWRVDDAVTREFMLSFYASLWRTGRKTSVAEALWNAKQALRRRPEVKLEAWAGWVLTGLER